MEVPATGPCLEGMVLLLVGHLLQPPLSEVCGGVGRPARAEQLRCGCSSDSTILGDLIVAVIGDSIVPIIGDLVVAAIGDLIVIKIGGHCGELGLHCGGFGVLNTSLANAW